ncbi:MAG: Metal dependent phosphohydrolase [uncultured bacterium]|nr:MAG: Metal dependent phosphohydrolase [uncultured bacterium]
MEPLSFEQNPELSGAKSPEFVIQDLLHRLPELAKSVMLDIPENDNFKQNPDDPDEHNPGWHQFGIITHSEKFVNSFDIEAQEYFQKWGIKEKINQKISEQIDGKTKKELLRISMILHDLGKFARSFTHKDNKFKPNFTDHEAKSEELIKGNEQIQTLLKNDYKLTENQIKYIARCAGLHFELGKTKRAAKKSESGYNLVFAEGENCKEACIEIAQRYPDFKEEMGILFLCDSLSKTDVRINAGTDSEIEKQSQQIESVIQSRGLNPKLIAAIKQRPVNIAVAKTYFDNVL